MAGGKHIFLVLFFSKNRRLLLALAALAAIVAAVWLIVTLTNWLVAVNQEESIPWTVVAQDPHWSGEGEQDLPRVFVAGGSTYDQRILVDGWGISAQTLVPVDYLEDLGIHVLYGEVTGITYRDRRLQVYINEKEAGYQMVTVSKGLLNEGDLQVVFVNSKGVPLGYEEEYIYSVPLQYTMVSAGAADVKTASFMEVLDSETLPTIAGVDAATLRQHADGLLLYIHGGEVATIQRNKNTVRVYVNPGPSYQVVALDTLDLEPGQNTLRLIDSSDLQVKSQIIFWFSEK